MAEFTDFMNKRVEHFFQMFKELRSGSITYPEIAKRENVRPPINKVCQKLGVKKVAQMTSDEALLQAITSVVYDIEMKRRARLGEAGDNTDAGSADIDDLAEGESLIPSSQSSDQHNFPPGLDNKGTIGISTSAIMMDPSKSRKNQKAQQTKDRLAGLTKSDSFHISPNNSASEDGNVPKSARSAPLVGDAAELLKLALSVRAFNGRIQKALLQAQQRPGASPELANLTGAEVQNLVKSLCAIIGCKRLDCSVSHEATTLAVEKYVQLNSQVSPSTEVKNSFSADSVDLSITGSSPIDGISNQFRASPLVSSGLQIETPGLPSPSTFGPSFSPVQGAHNGYYPPYGSQDSPSQRGDAQAERTLSPAAAARSPAPVLRSPMTLDEVYQEFWELSYKLFLYVCNPYRHCQECLCVVEDLVSLLENCSELRSPLTALALDSVIQRAMYELSDKVSRPIDAATLQAIQNMYQRPADAAEGANDAPTDASPVAPATPLPPLPSVSPPDCSVRNIEMCIALMSRNVSPICAKIREDYYTAHRLPAPQLGQNWCDKVLTLTRQLQELIAWSSPHCQARVPAYVPSRRHSFTANAVKDTLFTDRSLSEGAAASSGHHAAPTVPAEPKVIDFISALSPNTATEIVTALKLKDATLCEVLRQIGSGGLYAKLPHDLESSIQLNLHKVIHQSISGDCSIVLCGAAVLGLSDAQSKIKLDFAALAAPYHTNSHDLSTEEQRADLGKFQEASELIRELERAVEGDKLTEIAWKHLKACARDFHQQSQEYIIKLTSNASPDGQQGNRGFHHGGHNNGYDYQNHPHNNHNNNYHNKYVLQPPQYGERPYQNPQYPGGAGTSPTSGSLPPELILEVAEDAECIRKIGDALVEKYFAQRMERTSTAPAINQILRKIEEMQEYLDKNERERVNFVRKFSKSLDRVLKENRYLYVRMVSNKARFTHINFEHQVAPHLQVSVNVIGCNPLPVQMTELVNDYINLDGTGKVRDFLQTVKLFASSHHISDPASGYLSSTAWYVMALHVLLKHGLLPNLHHNRLFGALKPASPVNTTTSSTTTATSGLNAATTTTTTANTNNAVQTQPLSARSNTHTPRAPYTPRELPGEYRERLQGTSLLVLLDLFFRYYVEQVNLFTSVVTLREQGALLPKVQWPVNPVLWRLSIEDPFEALGSLKPYDLGSTLSRPGQLTTFKALRRAVYGIHSIMADTSNDCHENISRLFSRVELINLARRSDYMGAVITASPAWVRPHEASLLDAPQYVLHSRGLYKKYEAPDALQLLLPMLSPRDGDFGSPGSGGRKSLTSGKSQPLTGSLSAKATEFQPSWLAGPGSSSSAHSSVHGSAPNSARSAMGHNSSPPGAGPQNQQGYKPQGQGQGGYPGQAYGQQASNQSGNYPYNNNVAGKQQGVPHLSQHAQVPGQGFDPRARPGQYRDEPPQQYHQSQGQGQGQRGAYPSGAANLNSRQAASNFPAQQTSGDPRYARSAGPTANQGPSGGYGQQQQQTQQQGRPFDPAAAALAASAERRYPVNQLAPSQSFDPKTRKAGPEMQPQPQHVARHERYGHGGQQPAHMQQQQPQHGYHNNNNLSARGDAPRYAVLEERYAKTETSGYGDDRYHSGNLAPRGAPEGGARYAAAMEGRYGNQTAREPVRYPAEELQASANGSMSARYASLEDRYGGAYAQAPQTQPSVQQQMQPQQRRELEPAPRMQQQQQQQPQQSALPQGFKLDLQPRFAEDRYNYAQDSARSVSATSSAYPSARGPDDRSSSYALSNAPVNIGNLSARRMSELNALSSPRLGFAENSHAPSQSLSLSTQALAQVNEHQKQKKSPVVPLIPLEGLSNFSGSSGSEYSNPMYSDRSSHYISTGRSDGLGDTGRSTLVAGGGNGYYGPPGSGRSTATHQHLSQYPSAMSMGNYGHVGSAPNTSRSVEFSLGASVDSNDDYRQGYFGGGLGGISLTARSLEDSLQLTDRNPNHSSSNDLHPTSDSLLTNRLDYMGLDDLSAGKGAGAGLPLSAVRPPQPPLLPLQKAHGASEFDDMLTRLNQSSLSHSQSMSLSQSSGGRASFVNDLPLNSARSVHSGSAPSRRESLNEPGTGAGRSPGDLHTLSGSAHSLYPVVPQRAPSITQAQVGGLDLQGLLGYPSPSEADLYGKVGGTSSSVGGPGAAGSGNVQSNSYLKMLFNDAPPLDQE